MNSPCTAFLVRVALAMDDSKSERLSFFFLIRGNRFDQRGLKIELDRNIYSSSVTGRANESHGGKEWQQMMLLLMMLPLRGGCQ